MNGTWVRETTEALSWTLGTGRSEWVSVIVPVYNREELIFETLDSVYAQTYRPIELIVVDDGSYDSTVEATDDWIANLPTDDQFVVRILRQENAGAAVARNHGTLESEGEFIQYLDSDDVLDPNKITCQVRALKADPATDFAYGPVSELRNPDHVVYCQTAMSQRRMILKNLVVPTIQTMSALMRRTLVEQVGCWNSALPPCEDWEYYSRVAVLGGRGAYVEGSRSYYREHRGRRLSEHSELNCTACGRLGQIDSMLAHATASLRSDSEFAKTAAWQLLIATARFVDMGWRGDEAARYRQASAIGNNRAVSLTVAIILRTQSWLGRRTVARLFLVFPWGYYRLVGLMTRFGRYDITSSRSTETR